jgi:hypothetical protein
MNVAFSAASGTQAQPHRCSRVHLSVPGREEEATNRITKVSMIASAQATVGMSATAASAETRGRPITRAVSRRAAALPCRNVHIHEGVASGRITPRQAQRLHAEDHAIRIEERVMARFNGGHISKAERRALNQQENAVSRQIGP